MPPQIVALRGSFANQSFPLGDMPLAFGRSPDNSIVLTTPRASRHHAEIRRDGADFVLSDLGSANGTLVNGQRLTAPHRLRSGDTFEIGDDAFRFDAPQPAVDATLIAAPAPVVPSAPPTVPVGAQQPPVYQPPQPAQPAQPIYQPPPQPNAPQGGYVGNLPNTPPLQASPPAKRGNSRTLLVVLGLVGLVFVAVCIGGAALIYTRAGSSLTGGPTPAGAPTRQSGSTAPTEEDGPAPTREPSGNNPVPTREPVAGGADWTVLVYLDGDNNLERDAVRDFNEMEMVGSTDQVKIVVQFDRVHQSGQQDDDSNGDWDTTKRFLVEKDDDEETISTPELEDLGEVNMGDPQSLADFVAWGVKEYPAQHYALVLWDHGSSWAGIAFDDTDGEDGINMPELDAALRTAGEHMDLIGFDACLMAQLDVLQTVAPYGDVAVASAEIEPNDGWAWDLWLAALSADPSADARTVATMIVDSYQQYYEQTDKDTVTLSAFDLSRTADLRDGLNALSDAMIADIDGAYQSIAEARSYAAAYSQPKPEEFSAVDLGHFAQLISENGAPDGVAGPAQELAQMIAEARIAEWHSTFHTNSSGLSVFFPQVSELYPDLYEQASPLPQETSWAEFLSTFYGAGTTQVSAPDITDLQLSDTTVGFGNPATLEGTIAGKDLAYVFFFVGIPNESRDGVELTNINFIYPPGSSPNAEVPPWNDGTNDVAQSYNGSRWAISNGTDTIPVLLGPAKYGTDLYGVEGVYTSLDSGQTIAAGLLFQVDQGRATLQAIYGFPKGKQETQPFEITPASGDTFTAMIRTYMVSGDKLTPDLIEGETITFGDEPLSALQVPAENGDYVAGFMVRDISGYFSYAYQDITIDNTGAAPIDLGNQPAPTTGPAQGGMLAYSNPDLGFSLEYPEGWETLDDGNSKIYFYEPAESSQTVISVDVYSLNEEPDQANELLLQSLSESLAQEQDLVQGDVQPFDLGGQEGQSFAYSYTNQDGISLTGVAVVVTSPNTGLNYLVIVQALSDDFDGVSSTFDEVLNSMEIE